ncbi:HEPN domain-containing protein [Psychrobacter okhotskensis]|uniref:HEPN domain-containing protein n=1 Tax=Psychrobacter okhotskensis TaxID=212403 RepID=UPI003CFD085B
MFEAKSRFDDSYSRIKTMHSLYDHLLNNSKFPHDMISDILRSELVSVVSALDRFIHDIVKVGIIESYNGQRQLTNSCSNFQINIGDLKTFLNPTINQDPDIILGDIIDRKHSHLSFQDPKKIADALSLFWDDNQKWQTIASQLGSDQNTIKVELKNIIIRRNQIVHEADFDAFQNQLQIIKANDVENSVEFINNLVEVIYNLIKI